MTTEDLFERATRMQYPDLAKPTHDGASFDAGLDGARLKGQQKRVFDVMRYGQWRTLREIAALTGDGEASISARLRDFRKPKFGSGMVFRRRRGEASKGVFEYRMGIEETT